MKHRVANMDGLEGLDGGSRVGRQEKQIEAARTAFGLPG